MKKLLLLLLAVGTHSFASSKISYLSVKGEVVYFSTTQPKTHTIPSCVVAENQQLWAVPLGSLSGRAMYSILVTAVATNSPVNIEPKNSCSVVGVEAPNEVSIGTVNGLPVSAGLYKSCNEIIQNDPFADDGHYNIRPGTGSVMRVYCDMEVDGGWTLVMHGKEGDVPFDYGWPTDGVNVSENNSPDGTTFKFADWMINALVSSSYRVTHNSIIRYMKPSCLFSVDQGAYADCRFSYKTPSFGSQHPNNANNSYNYISSSALSDYSVDGNQETFFFMLSRNEGWYISNGYDDRGVRGDGYSWGSGMSNYSASFSLWVK